MTHEGPGGEQALPGGFGVQRSAHRDERHRQFFRAIEDDLDTLTAVALLGTMAKQLLEARAQGQDVAAAQGTLRQAGSLLGLTTTR